MTGAAGAGRMPASAVGADRAILVDDREHIDEDDLVDLHDDLLAAVASLAEAYDLDQG